MNEPRNDGERLAVIETDVRYLREAFEKHFENQETRLTRIERVGLSVSAFLAGSCVYFREQIKGWLL